MREVAEDEGPSHCPECEQQQQQHTQAFTDARSAFRHWQTLLVARREGQATDAQCKAAEAEYNRLHDAAGITRF